MNGDFMVMILTCGFTSCYPPTFIDLKHQEPCVRMVNEFSKYTQKGRDGFNAICISKINGELLASAIPLDPIKKSKGE